MNMESMHMENTIHYNMICKFKINQQNTEKKTHSKDEQTKKFKKKL